MQSLRRCLTTGVLNRNTNTNVAHIEVANFSDRAQRVIVTVYNWDVANVSAIPGCTFDQVIPANENATFNCPLPAGVVHYEVRMNLPVGPNIIVIANTFGVTGPPTDPNNRANQEGNTVLFRDLIPILYNECIPGCGCD